MAPSEILRSSFFITRSGLKKCSTPNPSHFSQAPAGLLNEKVRGSSSGIEYPHSGHANLFEKRMSNDENLKKKSIDLRLFPMTH